MKQPFNKTYLHALRIMQLPHDNFNPTLERLVFIRSKDLKEAKESLS